MKLLAQDFLSPTRRAWLVLGVLTFGLPVLMAGQALDLVNPELAAKLEGFGTAAFLVVFSLGLMLAVVDTQPKRRGQTTFERLQSLAQSRRPPADPALAALEQVRLPKWLAWAMRPSSRLVSMIERIGFALAALAAMALIHAPDDWITRSLGAQWLSPQARAPVLIGLIGVASLLSVRLTGQSLDLIAPTPETAPPAASETSPATPPKAPRR